jgi:hypothetical protein
VLNGHVQDSWSLGDNDAGTKGLSHIGVLWCGRRHAETLSLNNLQTLEKPGLACQRIQHDISPKDQGSSQLTPSQRRNPHELMLIPDCNSKLTRSGAPASDFWDPAKA